MRIYSSRGFFGLSGDCSIELLGNFTDYDGKHNGDVQLLPEETPATECLSPEVEHLLEVVAAPTPRRLSGMLSR